VVVGVINNVHELAGLRVKSSDFTITPSTDNAFTVLHEGNAVAFKIGNLNSEEFLAVFSVPDSDIVHGASSKEIGIVVREGDVIDLCVMASVSELCGELITVDPVDV